MRLTQRSAALLFALTLFVSAALLFSVQPMIAKMLLPLLGGTPAVWNTCMVFFQAVLLAGYAYALFVSRRPFHQQVLLQLLILLLAFLSLPIGLSQSWVNSVPATGNPSLWLLTCLSAIAGLPFFIVSSNGPLLQKWFAQTGFSAGRDPYFLYSASNAGSFVALLSYPILFEPIFKLRAQSLIWTGGYALLLGLIVLDAFSSDAIPVHLITQQALDLYLSKLAPDGLLVFHISNRHLNLSPVMADLAASRNLHCIGMYDPAPYNIQGKDASVWIVMTREANDAGSLSTSSYARTLSGDSRRRIWTDDFSNILSVLSWR